MTENFPHIPLDHIAMPSQETSSRKNPPASPKFSPEYLDHGPSRGAHAKHLNQSLANAQNAAMHARSKVPGELRPDGFSAVAVQSTARTACS
ncbi:hypothetical protein GCM10023063_22210 [Arthrobacter methylotrophus]